MTGESAPVVILYEHPTWFEPLFAGLERRGVRYRQLLATNHILNPQDLDVPALVFNRMSASAHTRGHGDALMYAADVLTAYELNGVPVINGTRAYAFETSKAKQLALLASLGLRFPASRVVHRADQIDSAARALRFPVVFKPNVGGRGAGILRFDDDTALHDAAACGALAFGPDCVGLLQEYVPKRDGRITRVEVVGGNVLYAIDVRTSAETFDLCPADMCDARDGARPNATRPTVTPTAVQPPAEVIAETERICRAAGIDVGGVEFLTDDRDGARLYYDINALSNFVANPTHTLGFNPWERLVDYVEERLRSGTLVAV